MNESSSPIGFVAPEPSELAPLFPAYEIHDLIATGGMGAVYSATQKSLDRTVALKILPMDFSEDAEFCAGFEAEAKAMARLNHRNLIAVYDFGEVKGMLFIVMEFVPGKSIFHSAHGMAIDPTEVIRLVTGICNGLGHAHENGILHRDIKPSNILLTLQAEPKIGDFGLARPIERKTQQGEVIFGTPGYTAPEVMNFPETVDHRADLFSVGVLLHELLTGKLPADDSRPASAISGCDARFDSIIRKATSPNPDARYSTTAEIAGDLGKISAMPATSPMAIARATPKAGTSRPPMPRRATTATSKPTRKKADLSWVGLLLAIGVSAYAWHFIANLKPREILVERPGSDSSVVENHDEVTQKVEEPAPNSEEQPPPFPQSFADTKFPETGQMLTNESPGAQSPEKTTGSVFEGEWEAQNTNWRLIILKGGNAICYKYKDRNWNQIVNKIDSSWKLGDATDKMDLYWEKNPAFANICTMNSTGDSFNGINQRGERNSYRRIKGNNGLESAGKLEDITNNSSQAASGDANHFNGKSYKVIYRKCSWADAKSECEKLGGQLVVIHDQATQDFVKSIAGGKVLWLGATDDLNEGTWKWVDGTEMKFKPFAPHQPDNARGNENHLLMWPDGKWNDAANMWENVLAYKPVGYICEWGEVVAPHGERIWRQAGTGRTTTAELLKKTPDNSKVTILLKGTLKPIEVDSSTFSQDDQAYIRAWKPSVIESSAIAPAQRGIVLDESSKTDQSEGGNSVQCDELMMMFGDLERHENDTAAHPETIIYSGPAPAGDCTITYLMPRVEAERQLLGAAGLTFRAKAVGPGFPAGLVFYNYDRKWLDFDHITIMTDIADQVVSFQFRSDHKAIPLHKRLPEYRTKTVNFIDLKVANDDNRAFTQVDINGAGRDSILVNIAWGRFKETEMWFLPRPFVRQILFHIDETRKTRGSN